MSRIFDRLRVIRDNVGKITDVTQKAEDTPEKRIAGKFVKIDFPIITRGTIPLEADETQQSEEG